MSAHVFRFQVWATIATYCAKLATIGALALEAYAAGDRELLADCRRWHEKIAAALRALPSVLWGDQ
jgi:hypothetical protein